MPLLAFIAKMFGDQTRVEEESGVAPGTLNELQEHKLLPPSRRDAWLEILRQNSQKGNHDMADQPIQSILDEIEKNLTEHEDAIKVIATFMEHHALAAGSVVDPTRLAGIKDRIQAHTVTLSQLLLKFPIVK